MKDRKAIGAVILFAGTVLCFFLPFMTVSCQGNPIFTLTGRQLATGTTISMPQAFGPPKQQQVNANPFALVAGLCGIAGIALSIAGRKMLMGSAAAGATGAVSLLIMKSQLAQQIQSQGMGMTRVDSEIGFTLSLILFLAATGWSTFAFLKGKARSAPIAVASLTHQ